MAVLGAVVPAHCILARSDAVVAALTAVVAYPTGCTFDLRLAARRTDQSDEDWWDLHAAFFQDHRLDLRHRHIPGHLPVEWLRFGVQFADGTKATTTGASPWDVEGTPEPPVLCEHGGGGGGGGDDGLFAHRSLWLWPLPPAEPFDFVIEWPIADIPLTRVQLDGAAINAAAERAEPFWPDWQTFTPPGVVIAGLHEPAD